jgi:hypothetical protein
MNKEEVAAALDALSHKLQADYRQVAQIDTVTVTVKRQRLTADRWGVVAHARVRMTDFVSASTD